MARNSPKGTRLWFPRQTFKARGFLPGPRLTDTFIHPRFFGSETMSEIETVPTVANGRLPSGKFGTGNTFSARRSSRAAELRRKFVEAVTPEDVEAIAETLVRMAKDGDVQCAKLVLDRLGKATDDNDEQGDIEESRNRVLEMLQGGKLPVIHGQN